jgi:lysozyme family protein
MTATVDTILSDVLDREGWPQYTEHPHDKGGPTKGGITLRTLESWRHRRLPRQDLARLKREEALQILRRLYIDANGIFRLIESPLLAQVVDSAVLSGPSLAVKEVQRLVDVSDDGICGPITMAAIDAVDVKELGRRLAVARALRLARFAVKHENQTTFLVGWLTRALSFV